ncbi:hypothetical protein HDU93_008481 [Gonapodya sp. JEL0774]|nr:hypothetical protein HDU93_008481 [Gonapodya sp. JEL0774]
MHNARSKGADNKANGNGKKRQRSDSSQDRDSGSAKRFTPYKSHNGQGTWRANKPNGRSSSANRAQPRDRETRATETCERCGKGGHSAAKCRTSWDNINRNSKESGSKMGDVLVDNQRERARLAFVVLKEWKHTPDMYHGGGGRHMPHNPIMRKRDVIQTVLGLVPTVWAQQSNRAKRKYLYWYIATEFYEVRGKGNRIRLPELLVRAIRIRYPNLQGVDYTGYHGGDEESEDGDIEVEEPSDVGTDDGEGFSGTSGSSDGDSSGATSSAEGRSISSHEAARSAGNSGSSTDDEFGGGGGAGEGGAWDEDDHDTVRERIQDILRPYSPTQQAAILRSITIGESGFLVLSSHMPG